MIGGLDIQIPTRIGNTAVEVAVRAIRQQWPKAVFENALTAERYDDFGQIPFAEIEEIFVYRDSQAADLWDAEGAVPAAHNTMIHLITDEDLLTVVVDERDTDMAAILSAISSALRDEILYVPTDLEAA